MSTTSSHSPNLRPTSRSTPIVLEAARRWSLIDASWPPTMRPIDRVEAVVAGQVDELAEQQRADAVAPVSRWT